MWQGAEQEFATSSQPIRLFKALEDTEVFMFKPETGIPRALLQNGGLCYIHSNLFEVCTPECRDSLELITYDKASEAYSRLASWVLEEKTGNRTHVYKTNIASDPKDSTSYTTVGSHENYSVERISYLANQRMLIPYMILRQIFVGSGGYINGKYLLSPRTIFPKKLLSETSTDYPILSTRDEPHSSEQYIRVHVVNGEGARSEYTNFLKYSITSYVLRAIEQGNLKSAPEIDSPLETNKSISENLRGDWKVKITNGEEIEVTDYINTYYLSAIEELFRDNDPNDQDKMALKEFKWTLEKLNLGLIDSLDESIEWVIKKKLAENVGEYAVDEDLEIESSRTAILNQYMAVTEPLYDELVEEKRVRTMVSEEAVKRAFYEPPPDSRGFLRVRIALEFKDVLENISWSYMKLKPRIQYEPIEFNDLNSWTREKIEKTLNNIRTLT
jgi:hypothetical protein